MTITPEQQIELRKFPLALRILVESELAVGNSIIEVGHSFPAPPAGAYIKLAIQVSTRERASSDGLNFYERNSSIYSGEFTDAQQFYYVMEPPNPPPAEPDMDAIRKSYEPQPFSPKQEMPTSHSRPGESDLETTSRVPQESEPPPTLEFNIGSTASDSLSIEESAAGSTRVLHFRDKRPPHEVKFALERDLRTLFLPSMENDKLCLRAKAIVVGADYDILLRFEAALPTWNCYSLRMDVSWAGQASSNDEYYRKTSGSWFALWTREFTQAKRVLAYEGSSQRYHQLCQAALNDQLRLDSVAAIQQAIIAAIQDGASFRTSHKEGDTNIYWKRDHFMRSDYGEYPDERHFTEETEFLKMLRHFCHSDVNRNSPIDQLSEIDTWRLILRQMDLP